MTRQSAAPRKLARARFAAALTVGAYPVITGLLYGLAPVINDWPTWQKTLAVVPLMVPAMVWGVIPLVNRLMRGLDAAFEHAR
jgi:antibiotic biosynthesis monooxygenase (ABM) superfamily enzyme